MTDADCTAGEECRDGVCERHGIEAGVEPVGCPEGCAPEQVCAGGICVGRIIDADADAEPGDTCGQCPAGWECPAGTSVCEPSAGDSGDGESDRPR